MAEKGTKEKLDIELEAPADFTSPEELYQDLIHTIRKYHPSDDITMIEKAYRIANEAHKEQKRKSGEPYIIHPLCVAIVLADLEMDKETIAAGLLHDVVEDTIMTLDQLTKEFGSEVSFLVDGVTKLTQLNWDKDKVEIQADNLRKMFLAMAKDIRVIIIKLADRLHNMRTGQYWKPEKQKEKARKARKTTNYMGADVTVYQSIDPSITTEFVGYDKLSAVSRITVLTTEDELVQALTDGQKGTVIVEQTPFYGTMGGQQGDVGVIVNENGEFKVEDTIHLQGGKVGHVGIMTKGMLQVDDGVTLSVCEKNRALICKNHSATHLLQKALRLVLGDHVEQAGSYVDAGRQIGRAHV